MPARTSLLLSLCFGSAAMAQSGGFGQITFTDVSAAAGIADVGISFGASAGDVDGDGWIDVFTGGHYTGHPRLWVNLRNGTFLDATFAMMPFPTGDMHGAQWADLDNDGSLELVLARGANFGLTPTPKSAYKRFGPFLGDIAQWIGLDVPLMRARTPVAADYDGDGKLDVFMTALQRADGLAPPEPYKQQAWPGFVNNWPSPALQLGSDSLFGVLGDLDGDHRMDLLLHSWPLRAYSFGQNGMVNISPGLGLPPTTSMYDAAIADLNGDGENEIYIAQDALDTSMHLEGNQQLELQVTLSGQEHGVRFGVNGPHQLTVQWGLTPVWATADIYIGAGGYHPTGYGITLDPNNPANTGIAPHTPGQTEGIFVGWNPATGTWTMALSSPTWTATQLLATTTAPITSVTALGFNPAANAPCDLLLERVNGTYTNRSATYGIPPSLHGRSVVAADFDNDMDLDLYVVTSTTCANTPNVLLENDGTGHFQPIAAGDAAGSPLGIGDAAITFDYDRDGDVDLFLVNGDGAAFRMSGITPAFGDDGPAQLLRNDTDNGNHWLDIVLVGTSSNRDGIGARIEVTTGGVRQMREHGGGMHRFSQNHGIHFGLGPNPVANRVVVAWPNGTRSVLKNVPADGRVVITQ